jgi:murein DD-endopeptidase MepM/ murein hydrolase activator NlpD
MLPLAPLQSLLVASAGAGAIALLVAATQYFRSSRLPPIQSATGTVSSEYGVRWHPVHGGYRMHYGIDIAGVAGKPVRAVTDGTIEVSRYSDSAGNYVILRDKGVTGYAYMHLDRVFVAQGTRVTRGQHLGTVGATGTVTGPHLHFEVLHGKTHVNPRLYFAKFWSP